MNILYQSERFAAWLENLKDMQAKSKILARLRRAELGNFGDSKPVGLGIYEMRIHTGPGYRLYYTQRGNCVYLLLVGGDKASQQEDIAEAQTMAAQE